MFQAKGCTIFGTTDKNIAPLLDKLEKEKTLGTNKIIFVIDMNYNI